MVKFTLIIHVDFGEEEKNYEGFLKRNCEMPIIPRIGEGVTLEEYQIPFDVESILHNVYAGTIEVYCNINHECLILRAFILDEKNWEYESGSEGEGATKDTQRFYQAVEDYKKNYEP